MSSVMIRKRLALFSYRPHYNGSKDDPQGTFVPQSTNVVREEAFTTNSARNSESIRAGSILTYSVLSGIMTESKLLHAIAHTPKWWNWQTRCVQGAVGARPWGFESPLRHHKRGCPRSDVRDSSFHFTRGRIQRVSCGRKLHLIAALTLSFLSRVYIIDEE